jgi:hypothetical protein
VLGLVGAGSGNAFALLPPQNASGNWIKIVQRLPVRIASTRGARPQSLRIGLSVTVTVDTRDQSGPPVAARRAPRAVPARRSRTPARDVEAQIARIIAANRGSGRPSCRRPTRAPGRRWRSGSPPLALALGTFMQVLDGTIANVSLPTIAGNLGASTDERTWVITAFAAANGVTVPLTGWLMGRFGVVRTFVVSVPCSPSPPSCAAWPGACRC